MGDTVGFINPSGLTLSNEGVFEVESDFSIADYFIIDNGDNIENYSFLVTKDSLLINDPYWLTLSDNGIFTVADSTPLGTYEVTVSASVLNDNGVLISNSSVFQLTIY